MSDNAPADLFIAALEDLRLGVTLDRHNLPDGDVKIAALDAAMAVLRQRLSLDASQARVAELEAARFSYAKEFPPDGSGDPDVGSIHENIRKLKEQAVSARSTAMEVAYQTALAAWEKCDNSAEVGSTILKALHDLNRQRDQKPAESAQSTHVVGGAQLIGYIHPDTLAQLAFPMTPYREVPLYRVHRPHLDFDAKRPAGLVPIFTAAPAAEHQSTVGEVIARVSDIRDELNRLGMMAHTAMNQDASDMRNIMEDLAERLVQLGGGWITTSANGHKGAPVDTSPGHNPGTRAYDVLEHLPPLSGNSPWDFVYTARVVTVEDAKEYARAVLASAPVACDHQFHFFVDQTERRCNRCGVIESKASAPVSAEILFWYRPRSDGGYEGPIHNDRIEDSRKLSGSWVPLVARRKPDQDGHVWDAPRPSWMEGGEGAVEMAREDGLLPASAAVDPAPAAGDGRHDA